MVLMASLTKQLLYFLHAADVWMVPLAVSNQWSTKVGVAAIAVVAAVVAVIVVTVVINVIVVIIVIIVLMAGDEERALIFFFK